MDSGGFSIGVRLVVFLALVAGVSVGVVYYGTGQALDQLAKRGEADLALAADRLTGQLQRYQEMAVLLSDHPTLARGAADDAGASADALLQAAADKTAALNLIFADAEGRIVARANEGGTDAVLQGPWYGRAMQGALGAGHGLYDAGDGTPPRRAYVFAAPAFAPSGAVRGALIVVVDVDNLESAWRGSRPAVFFTDAAGEVFVSNRSELLFWRRAPEQVGLMPQQGSVAPVVARQRAGHEVWTLDWGGYIPRTALHLVRELPVIGMRAEALVDIAPARRLARLQAAVVAALCLAFGAFLFMATERRRALALANQQLEARVVERTSELSDANRALRREISERLEAEAALRRAQAELVQAGKLSALGQMSAGISHELNQPLMAIQQYADNGAAYLERGKPEIAGENLSRISALAGRAARIIKNLRAFARNESEPMGRVDIVAVIDAALELTAARLRDGAIAVEWDRPQAPVYVRGGEVRLGQVMVNLITNAADAMDAAAQKRLVIAVKQGAPVRVTVRDTGPGIIAPEKIFDPFYSTKEVGGQDGMGLGLSISYGLVQSFGGNIKGSNAEDGGAVFSVELEHWGDDMERAA